MCHSNNNNLAPSDLSAATETAPRRRNRTKTRKPKFMSLRVQMSQQQQEQKEKEKEKEMKEQVMNLFPLHPENQDDENVALLFTSEAPETLNGLLEEESTTATTECNLSMRAMEEEANGRWLVRKAMKRRSKLQEERWVCYSEVTSYTYSSSTTESTATTPTPTAASGMLSLKLDYEGVLNAWSHQRSLYVPGDTPLPLPHLNVVWQGNSSSSSGSSVKGCEKEQEQEEEEEEEGKGKGENKKKSGMRIGEREASVLRYKQKRLNRLFSKRIRYEVRKLNAEKRPRMKGRFVKRD